MFCFVIWGAGRWGGLAASYIGYERIVAFIDSDVKKQGKRWENIPIVSFETYLIEYKNIPIIIASKYSENEILKQLMLEGIEWAFSYSVCSDSIPAFLCQSNPLEILREYNEGDVVDVYGFNLLSIIVCDMLLEKKCICRIIHPRGMKISVETRKKFSQIFFAEENDCNPAEKLIVTEPISEMISVLTQYGYVENLFNLHMQLNRFYKPKIASLRNCHKGNRCFIVATGPSLRVSDLDILYKNQEISISMNGIFYGYEHTKWRPRYYIVGDPFSFLDYGKDFLARTEAKINFVSDLLPVNQGVVLPENTYFWHHVSNYKEKTNMILFSDDFSLAAYSGNTIAYTGALQLATYMGFSEIYLLGADCTRISEKEYKHFSNEPGNGLLDIDTIFRAYATAEKYASSNDIKIFNATRGGNLEVFTRVSFDDLFDK